MHKYGFVFPGQGSQKPGMGKDLYEEYSEVRKVFEKANSILGKDISKICFEGSSEDLRDTTNAQPGILLVSVSVLELLKKRGVYPTIVAGHSLGEITAYYATNVVGFDVALDIINKRGQAMAGSFPPDKSAMAAVISLEAEIIEEEINKDAGVVVIANYNSPGQIVISGEKEAVERVSSILKDRGGRILPLNVGGPFHSPLLERGVKEFKNEIASITMCDAEVPIILNRTAKPETKSAVLKENLPLQIKSPVNWIDVVRCMAKEVDVIIECGPGKVLSGLVKKICPECEVKSIGDLKSLDGFAE